MCRSSDRFRYCARGCPPLARLRRWDRLPCRKSVRRWSALRSPIRRSTSRARRLPYRLQIEWISSDLPSSPRRRNIMIAPLAAARITSANCGSAANCNTVAISGIDNRVMKKAIFAAAFFAAAAFLLISAPPEAGVFLEKPYLQLGDAPKLSPEESLVVLWHTVNTRADWKVEVRTSKDAEWRAAGTPAVQSVSAPAGGPWASVNKDGTKKENPPAEAIAPHLVYRAQLTNLVPGEEFHYRLLKAGKPVFDSVGHARKSARQPFRFALFGDCGQGTPSENAIAYQN